MNHTETSDLPDRPSGPREESFSVTSRLFDGVSVLSVRQQISRCEKSNYCQSAALCVLTLDTSHFSPHLAGKLLPWHPGLTDSCHRALVCVYKYVCACVCERVWAHMCVCVAFQQMTCQVGARGSHGDAVVCVWAEAGWRRGDGVIGWRGRGRARAGAKRENSGIRGFKGQLGGNVGKLRQLKFTLIGPLVTFQLVYSKFKFTDVCRQLH